MLVAVVGGHDVVQTQSGQIVDGAPQVVEDRHHHQHRGNGDHRVAEQVHVRQLGVERLAAGRAADQPAGEDVVHRRGEEEGAAQPVGGVEQAPLEDGGLSVRLQLLLDARHVEHLVVVQQAVDQRLAGAGGEQHGQADDAGDGRLLDRQPATVQLQQADAAGEQHADQTEQGDEVELAVAQQLEGAPAQREGQG
ncbi:hypothetical protein D3C75_803700 [compost metagenome]